jgi:hypothetical protein
VVLADSHGIPRVPCYSGFSILKKFLTTGLSPSMVQDSAASSLLSSASFFCGLNLSVGITYTKVQTTKKRETKRFFWIPTTPLFLRVV